MRLLHIIVLSVVLASSVVADIAKFDPPDKRLDKTVTLEVDHAELQDVVKSLSDQSGVTVKAGTGERDWKIREQKVTIRAKGVPVGRMIDELTELLKFYVSREGKTGEWTYVIWQDKKSRDEEAALVDAEKDEAARKAREIRKSTEDAAKKALGMTQDEALKLRDKDPFTAFLGGTKSGRAYAQMIAGMNQYLPGFQDGARSFVPLSGLPAGMQAAIPAVLGSGIAKALGGGGHNQDLTPDTFGYFPLSDTGDREASFLGIEGMMFISGLPKDGGKGTYQGPFGPGRPMAMFPIMRADSPFGRFAGQMMFELEQGMNPQDIEKQMEEKFRTAEFLGQAIAKESKTEKDPPTDPELTREVELKDVAAPKNPAAIFSSASSPEDHGKTIAAVSDALGMPVMLESFDRLMPLSIFLTPGKQPVYKILIGIEKAGYEWELENKSLRLRPSNWATRRAAEIPDSFVAYYIDLLDKQGELTMDDLAAIANALTDEQLQTMTSNPDINFAMMPLRGGVSSPREILRLYATLTPRQKDSLESEAGLQFAGMNDAQWSAMSRIIADRMGVFSDITAGSVQLVALTDEQIKSGTRSRTFRLTAHVSDEQEPRTADLSVYMQSKESMTAMIESRKKAKEAAEKAREQAKSSPSDATQTQPAPAAQQ